MRGRRGLAGKGWPPLGPSASTWLSRPDVAVQTRGKVLRLRWGLTPGRKHALAWVQPQAQRPLPRLVFKTGSERPLGLLEETGRCSRRGLSQTSSCVLRGSAGNPWALSEHLRTLEVFLYMTRVTLTTTQAALASPILQIRDRRAPSRAVAEPGSEPTWVWLTGQCSFPSTGDAGNPFPSARSPLSTSGWAVQSGQEPCGSPRGTWRHSPPQHRPLVSPTVPSPLCGPEGPEETSPPPTFLSRS